MAKGTPEDPKGLIYEAYRIDGITKPDCRTIFLDWALSLPANLTAAQAMATLIDRHGQDHPDHPMTQVLHEGMQSSDKPRRRGGWRSRSRPSDT